MIRALLIAAALAWTLPAWAQGVPIGALPNATLPLTGSEYTVLSQSGNSVKATVTAVGGVATTCPTGRLLGNVSGVTAAASCLTGSQAGTALGLGTAAFANLGTSGATVPLLSGANSWGALQTLTAGLTVSAGATNLAGLIDNGTLLVTGGSSLGTVTAGTWNGTVIGSTYGGTGVNNGASTLTLAGNLATAGAFASTLTMTAPTAVTLPTTGTLATLAGAETLTNKTITTFGGAFTFDPANASATLSPTGTGTVTIHPATAGSLDNVIIGGTAPLAAAFSTAIANTAFRSTDFGSGSTSSVNLTTSGGTAQVVVTHTASASRTINLTGSNGGNPTISTSAGSLAVTPAAVFASTVSAAGLTVTGATSPLNVSGSDGTSGYVLTSGGAGVTPMWMSVSNNLLAQLQAAANSF